MANISAGHNSYHIIVWVPKELKGLVPFGHHGLVSAVKTAKLPCGLPVQQVSDGKYSYLAPGVLIWRSGTTVGGERIWMNLLPLVPVAPSLTCIKRASFTDHGNMHAYTVK